VGLLKAVIERAHEGPEPAAVREKHTVADAEIACARVDDDGRAPRRAAVLADAHVGLLGGRVLIPLVEPVGGVDLFLVPGESHAERPVAAVDVGPPLLDDVECDPVEHRRGGLGGQRHGRIPEHDRLRRGSARPQDRRDGQRQAQSTDRAQNLGQGG
jgi:hypothetical protein